MRQPVVLLTKFSKRSNILKWWLIKYFTHIKLNTKWWRFKSQKCYEPINSYLHLQYYVFINKRFILPFYVITLLKLFAITFTHVKLCSHQYMTKYIKLLDNISEIVSWNIWKICCTYFLYIRTLFAVLFLKIENSLNNFTKWWIKVYSLLKKVRKQSCVVWQTLVADIRNGSRRINLTLL